MSPVRDPQSRKLLGRDEVVEDGGEAEDGEESEDDDKGDDEVEQGGGADDVEELP